jgi:hypothetical protein
MGPTTAGELLNHFWGLDDVEVKETFTGKTRKAQSRAFSSSCATASKQSGVLSDLPFSLEEM